MQNNFKLKISYTIVIDLRVCLIHSVKHHSIEDFAKDYNINEREN